MSEYEELFIEWLKSAKELGYVIHWEYEPKTFTVCYKKTAKFKKHMKTKISNVVKTIIEEITYTPDFYIVFSDKFLKEFPNAMLGLTLIPDYKDRCWIDIKSKFQGKANGSNREFPSKRAMLFDRNGTYVTRVTLDKKYNWFYYTYVPKEIAFMKNRKVLTIKKMFKNCKIK